SPYSITPATFNSLSKSAATNDIYPTSLHDALPIFNAASLTGSITNQSKTYGSDDPSLSGIAVTLTGIVNRTVSTWNGNVLVNDTGNVATTLTSLTRSAGDRKSVV